MAEPATKIKLFNKWTYDDVECKDISLRDYISVAQRTKFSVALPHTAGRYQVKRFRKVQCPIVERLVNTLMRHGRNNGKKMMAIRYFLQLAFSIFLFCFLFSIVKHAFEIIKLMTDRNPIQVLVDAICFASVREDSTRVGGVCFCFFCKLNLFFL
jgi:small subunit ribosomal protein S5e